MAKNTTGSGTNVDGSTFVHTGNMGNGLLWDEATKTYYVAVDDITFERDELGRLKLRVSALEDNQLKIRDDGIYQGEKPSRSSFYVDYLNGSDNNDGSREQPFKTVGKAIKSIEVNTTGSIIYLKERQKHYFKESIGAEWEFAANASYAIYPYGDELDALANDWFSNHLGYQHVEPVEASQAYQAIKPTLVFNGTTQRLAQSAEGHTFLEIITVPLGRNVTFYGIKFVCENTENVANSFGWFTCALRGAGSVIVTCCEMVQRDIEHGHFYLANSTMGSLTLSLRYFLISGEGDLFNVGQYPLNVYSSYDTVTDETVNEQSLTKMKYKGVASASQIFALTNDNNPKSFITNK